MAVLAVVLLWRLPSFFDPPWVNDEGTYFAVAQAMAHGYSLYAGVWENKPPALYLVYVAVYHSLGASLLAVRILATGADIVLVVTVMAIARRIAGPLSAPPAGMLAGLLMAVPVLEGTTANAEVFLTVFTALGVYLAVRRWYFLAGIAMAIAILFKVVAGFDAVALLLFLLAHGDLNAGNRARDRSLASRRAALYVGGHVIPLGGAVVIAAIAGILGPMLQDALLYPLGYVGQANGGGVPWLALVKVAILAVLTVWLIRKPFPALWLVWAAGGALISGRFFGHYALQAIPPLCVLFATELSTRKPSLRSEITVGLPIVFAMLAMTTALVGWGMAATGHDSIMARRLQWYANFVRMAVHAEPYAAYRDQVDDHVTRNMEIARRVRTLPAGKLLVWGNTPWVYVLSDRLPATRYTSSLRDPEVPGETRTLRHAVTRRHASIVVVIEPPLPPLEKASAALRRSYRLVMRLNDAAVYVAPAPRARLPAQ